MNEHFEEGFEKQAKNFLSNVGKMANNIGRGIGGKFGKPKLGRPVMPNDMVKKMKRQQAAMAKGQIANKQNLALQKAQAASRKTVSGLGKLKRNIKNKLGM